MSEPMFARTHLTSITLLITLALASSACSSAREDDYPSLAIRPAERQKGSFDAPAPEASPTPVAPAASGTVARLVQLQAKARAADGKFAAARPRAASAVRAAGGSAIGSEAWAVAQVALADLDSARSEAMIALADLDAMYVAAATEAATSGQTGDLDAIAAARAAVTAIVADEDRTLASLR